jgi:hypothetical protein
MCFCVDVQEQYINFFIISLSFNKLLHIRLYNSGSKGKLGMKRA